jgi:hypothetical protein
MNRTRLLYVFVIAVFVSFSIACSAWKTIEEPKWGFKLDVPPTLEDKKFEGKNLWVHEDSQLRVVVDFGTVQPFPELKSKKNYIETPVVVNGYDAIVCTFIEQENSPGLQFENVAVLIFQAGPESYGEGKPPVFRVEYGSEKDVGTALRILQTVRFYDPLAN